MCFWQENYFWCCCFVRLIWRLKCTTNSCFKYVSIHVSLCTLNTTLPDLQSTSHTIYYSEYFLVANAGDIQSTLVDYSFQVMWSTDSKSMPSLPVLLCWDTPLSVVLFFIFIGLILFSDDPCSKCFFSMYEKRFFFFIRKLFFFSDELIFSFFLKIMFFVFFLSVCGTDKKKVIQETVRLIFLSLDLLILTTTRLHLYTEVVNEGGK